MKAVTATAIGLLIALLVLEESDAVRWHNFALYHAPIIQGSQIVGLPRSGPQPPHGADITDIPILGIATLVAIAFQALFARQQVNVYRQQTRFLERQTVIAERQANLAEQQTALSKQQMVIANRPRLRVRNIVINHGPFVPNQPISGQFYVSNVGGTKARVVESLQTFQWNVNGLPMKRKYEGEDGNNPLWPGSVIPANLAATALFDSEGELFPEIERPGVPGAPRAFFMGWIDYLDDNDVRRRTAFCREFLQKDGTARFYPVEDPDYEYEE